MADDADITPTDILDAFWTHALAAAGPQWGCPPPPRLVLTPERARFLFGDAYIPDTELAAVGCHGSALGVRVYHPERVSPPATSRT